jgi:hypothetical protein
VIRLRGGIPRPGYPETSRTLGDAADREAIDSALAHFQWAVLVRAWYDGELASREEWSAAIRKQLGQADILVATPI